MLKHSDGRGYFPLSYMLEAYEVPLATLYQWIRNNEHPVASIVEGLGAIWWAEDIYLWSKLVRPHGKGVAQVEEARRCFDAAIEEFFLHWADETPAEQSQAPITAAVAAGAATQLPKVANSAPLKDA